MAIAAQSGIAEWVDPDTGQPAEDTLHRYND